MKNEIAALAEEAQELGEGYLTLRASNDLRLGLAARWRNGTLRLELEAEVRLLPSCSGVNITALQAKVDDLACLEAAGFRLFHYDDGWVLAVRPGSSCELEGAAERVEHLFAENRYPGRT